MVDFIVAMARVNFSVCLVLVLYQLSTAFSDESSSETSDIGLTGKCCKQT